MARTYETALAELNNVKVELEALSTISEAEACYIYNVDSKAEIIEAMNEDIAYYEAEVERLMPDTMYDEAIEIFGSYEAMNNYLY